MNVVQTAEAICEEVCTELSERYERLMRKEARLYTLDGLEINGVDQFIEAFFQDAACVREEWVFDEDEESELFRVLVLEQDDYLTSRVINYYLRKVA